MSVDTLDSVRSSGAPHRGSSGSFSGSLSGAGRSGRGAERRAVLEALWGVRTVYDLDVEDGGDHVAVLSCDGGVVAWWLGVLRALYPQDHLREQGSNLKLHPAPGVTLTLNTRTGALKVKGKQHMQWVKDNLAAILQQGDEHVTDKHVTDKSLSDKHVSDTNVTEMAKLCDQHLRLDDGLTLERLLHHLPASGAFRHGPSYIYRVWRGLLERWVGGGGDVYVVTPQLDARRLADLLLMLVKHKLSAARLHLYTMSKCDLDKPYARVLREARGLVKALRAPSGQPLIPPSRLAQAERRLDARYGRLYCKLIAVCTPQRARLLLTSASFHKWHLDLECGDTLVYFDALRPAELVNNYLAPLGLAHQVLLSGSSSPVAQHSSPVAKPASTVKQPSSPVAQHSSPVAQHSSPVAQHFSPVAQHSYFVVQPASSVAQPASPLATSSPVAQPSSPVKLPSSPVAQNFWPVAPSSPVSQNSSPVAQNPSPVAQHSSPVAPSSPVAQPSSPNLPASPSFLTSKAVPASQTLPASPYSSEPPSSPILATAPYFTSHALPASPSSPNSHVAPSFPVPASSAVVPSSQTLPASPTPMGPASPSTLASPLSKANPSFPVPASPPSRVAPSLPAVPSSPSSLSSPASPSSFTLPPPSPTSVPPSSTVLPGNPASPSTPYPPTNRNAFQLRNNSGAVIPRTP